MKVIILAAGEGSRLRPLTDAKPKCMVAINGKPVLEWQLELFGRIGISNISIVTGYKKEAFDGYNLKQYFNPLYSSTNMIHSLFLAEKEFNDDLIISYGDIIYGSEVLLKLMDTDGDIVIAADRGWRSYWQERFDYPLEDAETFIDDGSGNVISLGKKTGSFEDIMGQYIGLIKCSRSGINFLRDVYYDCLNDPVASQNAWESGRPVAKAYMTDILNFVASKGCLKYADINRGWFEVDNFRDLQIVEEFIKKGNGCL